jgi:ABC-type Zn2+ transport system substrate-binding protein/surface adhesin
MRSQSSSVARVNDLSRRMLRIHNAHNNNNKTNKHKHKNKSSKKNNNNNNKSSKAHHRTAHPPIRNDLSVYRETHSYAPTVSFCLSVCLSLTSGCGMVDQTTGRKEQRIRSFSRTLADLSLSLSRSLLWHSLYRSMSYPALLTRMSTRP